MTTTTKQNITLRLRKGTPEHKSIVAAVNQGIDAHLEAVTDSRFVDSGSILDCSISSSDAAVITRRLMGRCDPDDLRLVDMINRRIGCEHVDEFTLAYITAALWTEVDDDCNPLEDNYGQEDIHPEALQQIISDCREFQDNYPTPVYGGTRWTDAELAGHDFWLTRNGHGCGFWSRDQLSEQERKQYTDAAKAFGQCNLYVGDDGKLHVG